MKPIASARAFLCMTLVASCLVVACAEGPAPKVAGRAAFDLECPRDEIAVAEGSGCNYYARGCGRKAAYIVRSITAGSWSCCPPVGCNVILNSGVTKDETK